MQRVWNWLVKNQTGVVAQDDALKRENYDNTIEKFNNLFQETNEQQGHDAQKIKERKNGYMTMVNAYYDLVTDFYEYGWGQSFHFAPRFENEDFHASLARHEYYLALKLGLKTGMRCLDIGAGVGGPARNIARFSGAEIVGINNNGYQIKRAGILNQKAGLDHLCSMFKSDFMNLKVEPSSFDAAYAMEATCHAPDRVGCYSQVFKALKEGAYFANFEWVMTDNYDEKSAMHNKIKHDIEYGDSLPDLVGWRVIVDAVEKAGFEIVEHYDMIEVAEKRGNNVPWYSTLQGGFKPSQFKHSKFGRFVTQRLVDTLEFLRVAPTGTSKTHEMLCRGAEGLARGGEERIFTPMYFFLARKPISGSKKQKQ